VAAKLKNPRIIRITLHTFRHFRATMEYQRTKDILHVMRLLGHRNINNTLICTHLVDFETLEYVSKVARSSEEACKPAGLRCITRLLVSRALPQGMVFKTGVEN